MQVATNQPTNSLTVYLYNNNNNAGRQRQRLLHPVRPDRGHPGHEQGARLRPRQARIQDTNPSVGKCALCILSRRAHQHALLAFCMGATLSSSSLSSPRADRDGNFHTHTQPLDLCDLRAYESASLSQAHKPPLSNGDVIIAAVVACLHQQRRQSWKRFGDESGNAQQIAPCGLSLRRNAVMQQQQRRWPAVCVCARRIDYNGCVRVMQICCAATPATILSARADAHSNHSECFRRRRSLHAPRLNDSFSRKSHPTLRSQDHGSPTLSSVTTMTIKVKGKQRESHLACAYYAATPFPQWARARTKQTVGAS